MENQVARGAVGADDQSAADIAIIGAGLSGTLAAIFLGRRGIQVKLIDPNDLYPPDFRAEQLVGEQVEVLSRLGLLDVLTGSDAPAGRAVATRAGRVVGVAVAPHYGIHYNDMVNRARRHLPPAVEFIKAKVVDIQTSDDRQRIRLSDGTLLRSRLVVVASGLGQRLQTQLQIARKTIREAHSLTFGFDVVVGSPETFADTVLVAYGERQGDAIDYLTIFSIGEKQRANLFTYGGSRSSLTQSLLRQPTETLREVLPRLEQQSGGLSVVGPVKLYINDLRVATNYRREGVVLIGDAFQTPCPAAGTGIGRLLNDIDRLCNHHLPAWLATPGMAASKISAFYDDPLKQGHDAEALRVSGYRRALTIETSLSWRVHRRRVAMQNRLRLLVTGKVRAGGGMGMAPAAMAPTR